MTERSFVFLNHATPEDNAFTAWLGVRLAAAGYDVWSDILMLGGGETFWNDINEGIRRRAALFIPVLSPAASNPDKRGVHNEIAIAIQVQRRERRDTFVLPVLLEWTAEVNPELIQLNYIDFSRGWAVGLVHLLDRMGKLGIPRQDGPQRGALDRWLGVQGCLAGAVQDNPSLLASNWFPITSMPPLIRYVGTPAGRPAWDRAIRDCKLPMRAHMRLAVTFAEPSEIQLDVGPDIPIRTEYEMPTQSFMDGKPPRGMPELKGADARRMVVDMLRQGWEAFALSSGLKRYEMSGTDSWYLPEGLLLGDWGHFADETGRRGRRKLVGIRGKRKMRYHFAVSARPQVLPFPRLIIRSHVVFTEGGVVVTQKSAAQRNRKALCRNWWNSEWRDRQHAMVAFLAKGETSFGLPLGGVVAAVSASPMMFEAPCTYVRHAADEPVVEDEESDDFDEALADLDMDEFSSDDGVDE